MKLSLELILMNLIEKIGVSGFSVTSLLKTLVKHLNPVLSRIGIHLRDTLLYKFS